MSFPKDPFAMPEADAGGAPEPEPLGPPQEASHPGQFEELPRKVKGVLAEPFEGCKFELNKAITPRFQTSHKVNMSSFKPPTYNFGATYVGDTVLGPQEQFPVMIADYGAGLLQYQMIHKFSKRIQSKAVVHATSKVWSMYQGDVSYAGDDFTAQLTAVNTTLINPSGIWVTHYLQNITKKLALGGELMFKHGQGTREAFVTAGGRYKGENCEAYVKCGSQGTELGYCHQGNDAVSASVQFEYITQLKECVTSFGYAVDLPKGNMNFKGSLDSNWNVAGILEKRLEPFPFVFRLSGLLNHKKNQAKFGIGFTIG